MRSTLTAIVRSALLEGADKGTEALVRPYLEQHGTSDDVINRVLVLLGDKSSAELHRYDVQIGDECDRVGIKNETFRALALLESGMGEKMKSDDPDSSAAGIIHMTRDTYRPYFPDGWGDDEMEEFMLDPVKSIGVAADHLKFLSDKFGRSAEKIAYAVRHGVNKMDKMTGENRSVSSVLSDSTYTQVFKALRLLFSPGGPFGLIARGSH